MLPNYISEELKAYFQMSSEDRRKILDSKYFDTNPLTCIKEYLPYLAFEVGVNIDNLDEEDARITIDEAISALNYKGTVRSFKSSLKPYAEAEIKEWFETGKGPFTFDLDLSLTNKEITPELIARLKKLIEFTKNVRSKLDELILAYKTSTSLGLKAGNMGETRSEAEMIDGFTNSAVGFAYPFIGNMGETTATAEMMEV